jgi:hypothetical protein
MTLAGMIAISNLVQLLNAFAGIVVAPYSIITFCNPLLLNALPEDVL